MFPLVHAVLALPFFVLAVLFGALAFVLTILVDGDHAVELLAGLKTFINRR